MGPIYLPSDVFFNLPSRHPFPTIPPHLFFFSSGGGQFVLYGGS
jgi:hypothetical protein